MNRVDMSGPLSDLSEHEFIVLTTFRKNGQPVPTTVWFAIEGDRVYIQTMPEAGKMKRIRHTRRVAMSPSDARGNVSGPSVHGHARELTGEEREMAEKALHKKYGLRRTAFLTAMGSLSMNRRGYIEVSPSTDS